jgi:hypothetical protein
LSELIKTYYIRRVFAVCFLVFTWTGMFEYQYFPLSTSQTFNTTEVFFFVIFEGKTKEVVTSERII